MRDLLKSSHHVYMFAFACEPGRGSEPGVGWYFASALARHSRESGRRATLVTRPHRVDSIRAALAEDGLLDYLEVVTVALPLWFVGLTKKNRRWAYILWQLKAVATVRSLMSRRQESSAVHHVTFGTEAIPTFERYLGRNVPLVFGPAGSSQVINNSGTWRKRTSVLLRQVIGGWNLRRAQILIAQNLHVASDWERYSGRCIVEPNIVLEQRTEFFSREIAARDPRLIVSVGLLIERKRHDLIIDSLVELGDPSVKLMIIGDGPLEERLREHAISRGVEKQVVFMGKRTRIETMRLIAQAKTLVHASRQEGAGWVIGEAQTVGTTPIAIAGSGSDTVIAIGGGIVAADSSPGELARCIRLAQTGTFSPTQRWSETRLPSMLADWYSELA
jgi:glycosyltransferase involved in cell wall biosynthesis